MKRIPVISIEPAILKWARETRGFTIVDVAEKMKRESTEIESWEKGDSSPSFAQLEKLAYDIYKRPLATFFLPSPPQEPSIAQDFRTLPTQDISSLSPEFRLKVRRVKHHQLVLKELFDEINPSSNPLHKKFLFTSSTSPSEAASLIRSELGISNEQVKQLSYPEDALRLFKDIVENHGIYVFQEGLKEVSGFSLFDREFPVICLNGSDMTVKKIFTLFHELAHVLFNAGGVFRDAISERLIQNKDTIEIFCNQFAADFLVPNDWLLSESIIKAGGKGEAWEEDDINRLAKFYKVSRETVLRKLLNLNLTTQSFFQTMKRKWDGQYQHNALHKASKPKSGGPDYHTTNISHLGRKYIGSVIQGIETGKISELDAASFLGVKVNKLTDYAQNIADYASRKP